MAAVTARLKSRPPGTRFKGFAPLHALELDLGELPAGAPVRLLMHGFTDYFTATSVFAAHQANVTAVVPWVEAQRPDGAWRRISDDIGFPAGLLRTMTADLTRQAPNRRAPHPHLDEPQDLLGSDSRRHDAGGRGAGAPHGDPAGRRVAGLPRLPARD